MQSCSKHHSGQISFEGYACPLCIAIGYLDESHRELEKEREGSKYLAEIVGRLDKDMEEAEHKAWDSLGRYKFQMFGYWSAIWVHQNQIRGGKEPNPWREIVKTAAKGNESQKIYRRQH